MIIGLTGSIGAGKTSVARILSEDYGYQHIDADEIVSNVMSQDAVMDAIIDLFPDCHSNGFPDRGKIAEIVFSDAAARDSLTQLLYPIVEKVIDNTVSGDKNAIYVLDTPMLFESGFNRKCDTVLVVTAPDELRMKRVIERSKNKRSPIDEQGFRLRDGIQMSQAQKMELADWVIHNNDDIEALRQQVHVFVQSLGLNA